MKTSINQEVSVGKFTFHIQTEYYSASRKIVTNIFRDGAIVKRLEKDVLPSRSVDEQIKEFHRSVVSKILSRKAR